MIKASSQTGGSVPVPTGIVLTLLPPPPPLGLAYQLPVENSRIDHG